MAQVLESPLASPISSPLSTRSVLSINLADPRLQLPSASANRGGGAIEADPFEFHDYHSEDDNHDDEDERPHEMKSLLLVDNSSQMSFRSHASASMAASQEVLTQNAEFTQMTQDANSTSFSQSPIPPPKIPVPLQWGRLMPLHGGKQIDLKPKAPEGKPSSTGTGYTILGLRCIQKSDLFNVFTLGRSNKCEVVTPKLKQQQNSQDKEDKERRLHEWAYGLISNRHCRIFCTLPEDPKAARIPGSTSLPATSMEVYVEDCSGNGTMINGNILLERGQKRRLHSGDEISLVNTETLRKKVRDDSTLQKIQQKHSYVFVNVAHQQPTKPKTTPIPSHVFQPPISSGHPASSGKRRKGLVNVRAMNYPPGSRSPLLKTAHRSPLPSELGYEKAQPTPRSGNGGGRILPVSRGRAVPAAASSPRRIEREYEIRDLINRGSVGEVRRAINRQTGKERAVKIVSLPSPGLLSGRKQQESQQWQKEAEILRGLKHPYVVDLVDVFCTDAHLYLVMELCTGGDLFDRIVKKAKYTEDDSRKVMRRLLSAMHYLHNDKGLVHRDLKLENILLTSANSDIDVKITDFGVAKSTSSALKTFCGTPSTLAPEVLLRRHSVTKQGEYGKPADIWSLGVCLYMLLSGTPPYDIDGAKGMGVILEDSLRIHFPEQHWSSVSSEAKDLVTKMLEKDPQRRVSLSDAINDKWLMKDDGDTHRHPLEDPKLITIAKKRLFSGNTPVSSASPPPQKAQAKKKRKVSMEGEVARPLSPVENLCDSPSFSPPSSPSSTKRMVAPQSNIENDENRSHFTTINSQNQKQLPKPVTDPKASRQSNGLVRAAELEHDKICSQFTDEEESISSFSNTTAVAVAKSEIKHSNAASAKFAASAASKPSGGVKAKSNTKGKKAVSSKAKKASGASKKSKSSKASKNDDSKQTTLARWFQPVKKPNAK